VQDPGLLAALDALVDPVIRAGHESALRWTCKSTRQLAQALSAAGHPTSHVRVGELLRGQLGFRLQAYARIADGKQHPDRDAQFRYINEQARRHLRAGQPVLGLEAKTKELADEAKVVGHAWKTTGRPLRVDSPDFPEPKGPRAYPYGVHDVKVDEACVVVDRDREPGALAAETLRRWWRRVGSVAYPDAKSLLICSAARGSDGDAHCLWKVELGRLATETGVQITVCQMPPGTSKWNNIEHRLVSAISTNWRGQPLTIYEVMVELIGSTSRACLKVPTGHDTGSYPEGIEVSAEELAAVPLKPHKFHGEWNYTIIPH
jgi:hypothetical protein